MSCSEASDFAQRLFNELGLKLEVSAKESPTECLLDISGNDAELLQAEGGELLQAVQHLVTQAHGRNLPEGQRIVCDVQGFRAIREAELRAMANFAAERVRNTGSPFMFGEMNSNERRIIHLTLAECTDLFTESIGEGSSRKVRVARKPAN